MVRARRLLIPVALLCLPGCRIVEDTVEAEATPAAQPPAAPTPAPAPEATQAEEPAPADPEPPAEAAPPAEGEPAQTEAEEPAAEPAPAGDQAAAPEAESAPAEPPAEATEIPAEPPKSAETAAAPAAEAEPKPAIDPGPLLSLVREATAAALDKASTEAVEAAARAARQAQHTAQLERARLYLAAAGDHLQHLTKYAEAKNVESSQLQLALVGSSLAGARRNLAPSPAVDELSFALAELHRIAGAKTVDPQVAKAAARLRAALAYLPAPAPPVGQADKLADDDAAAIPAGPSPGEDPAVLAREIRAVLDLFERKQNATGRQRLAELVLEVGQPAGADELGYAEATRRSAEEALSRRSWAGLGRAVTRLRTELTAVTQALGEPPAPAGAKPAKPEA